MTIVVSIQAVGIIMVVAMLVTPAATGQLLVDKFWDLVKIAIGVAVVAAVSGLYLSFYLNVASGASIVLVETLFFALALLFSPKSGWLAPAAGRATGDRLDRRTRPGPQRPRRAPRERRLELGRVGIPSRAPARVDRERGGDDGAAGRDRRGPARPRAPPPARR